MDVKRVGFRSGFGSLDLAVLLIIPVDSFDPNDMERAGVPLGERTQLVL